MASNEMVDGERTGDTVEVGSAAPDVILRDSDGAEVTFSSYWRERPLALVFLRHFG